MEKKELWHEMLTTYVCLMNYKNGITVPNMIGAYYNFNNSIDLSSSQCVVNVLNDILASQKSISVLINKCTNVNNYILSVLEKTDPRHPNINERIFVNMYDSNLKKCLCDVNELGENLYSLHYKEITSRRFSLNNGTWSQFSDIEIQHINNIIKSL